MTLRKTVETLREGGMDISFRVRPDGGIVVTKIGNIKYSGRAGNEAVRQIAGTPLPEYARQQRAGIAKSGVGGRTLGPAPKIDREVRNALQRAQRVFRKAGQTAGKPTTKNIRYQMSDGKTKEQIIEYLEGSIRYAKGLAQIGFLEAILEKAKIIYGQTEIPALKRGIGFLEKLLKTEAEHATTEQARDASECLYACETYANRAQWGPAVQEASDFAMYCERMLGRGVVSK